MSMSMSNNPDGSTSTSSILSDKVLRALEVRTDTPAMKAALEALAYLPSDLSMDSRSVRVAIEQDALHQAMLLQQELKTLVNIVSKLRQGISDTAMICHTVSSAIDAPVVQLPPGMTMTSSASAADPLTGQPSLPNSQLSIGTTNTLPLSTQDALEKEQQLAALLSDSFAARDEAAKRAETVAAFLETFDLSESDSILLDQYNFTDMDQENHEGMNFLHALERVKAIRTALSKTFDSDSLSSSMRSDWLGTTSTSSTNTLGASSAIRMMESLALKQERAYERLYHWLQRYLHLNSVTHVPTSSSNNSHLASNIQQLQHVDSDMLDEALSHVFVRKSLQVLHAVPAFYSHTLELIASSRRSEETRRFLMALTAGYQGRSPIELKAHDPVSYVGDMLAFCFQSCSIECHVAQGLVVVEEQDDGEDAQEKDDNDRNFGNDANTDMTDKTLTAADMLAHAMGGLARPLKSRILQVISSLARKFDDDNDMEQQTDEDEDAIARSRVSALYSICGLLLFYRSAVLKTIRKVNGTENPLVDALDECLLESSQAYVASLKVYAAMLDSLSLLVGISEAVLVQRMLEQISNVRMTSPGFCNTDDVPCPDQYVSVLSMEMVAETLLEAALGLCTTLDDSVTLKRSLAGAKKAGLSTTVASALDGRITVLEQTLIDDLVKSETKEVLELCGLAPLVTVWRNLPPVKDDSGISIISLASRLSVDDLDMGLKEFYSSLYAPPLPSFDSIQDPVLRKLARQKIAFCVVETYTELYNAILSNGSGYEHDVVSPMLGHTPDEVKTLFTA